MRVLVINSMFFHSAYRKCAQELGALDGVDLTVLTVDGWAMNERQFPADALSADSSFTFITGRVASKGKENRGFYISGMARAFKVSQPEVIFLMEEPYSLFALQVLFWRAILAPNTPIVFFTWNNLSLHVFDYHPTIWYRSVAKWVLPRLQYALTANRDAFHVLREQHFHAPVKYIGYGVDTTLFVRSPEAESRILKHELNISVDATVIGFIGRLMHMKGVDLLIDAYAELCQQYPARSFVLLLVGSGPQQEEFLRYADKRGIGQMVRHLPSIPQSEVPRYLSVLDILVVPSRRVKMWSEQFGRILVEAMATRTVVVGSSCGAIPEVVGEAGYIFEENNSDDLLRKLELVCQLSESDRSQLLDRAEHRARNDYPWSRFARESYTALQAAYSRSNG